MICVQNGPRQCHSNQQFYRIWSNSSNHFVAWRIMELGLTQPVISTMVVSWEKRRPMLRAGNLPPSCADCSEIRGASKFRSAKSRPRPVLGQLSNLYLVACSVDGATRTRNALRKKKGHSTPNCYSHIVKEVQWPYFSNYRVCGYSKGKMIRRRTQNLL
jgi:hypothetical protein